MQQRGRGRVHPLDVLDDPYDRCRFERQSDYARHFLVETASPRRCIDALLSIRREVFELGQQVADPREGLEVRRRSPGDVSSDRAQAVDHGSIRHVCFCRIAATLELADILEGDGARELAHETGLPNPCLARDQDGCLRSLGSISNRGPQGLHLFLAAKKRGLKLTQVVDPRFRSGS